jgi:hypothetical protein
LGLVDFVVLALINDLSTHDAVELVIVPIDDQLVHIDAFKPVVVSLDDQDVNATVICLTEQEVVVPVDSRLDNLLARLSKHDLVVVAIQNQTMCGSFL